MDNGGYGWGRNDIHKNLEDDWEYVLEDLVSGILLHERRISSDDVDDLESDVVIMPDVTCDKCINGEPTLIRAVGMKGVLNANADACTVRL